MKIYKSLRNSLLEYAVVNFSEVFDKFKDPSGNCDTILPPFLFEDVISKSKEIYWKIPEQELLECLPCRGALRWDYNNLTLTDFDSSVSLSNVNRIIKHLSINTKCIDDFVIEQISSFGASLLSLELTYSEMSLTKFSNAKFPRLRKLVIRNNSRKTSLQSFDFGENPDSLQELKVEGEVLNLSMINSLKCLSNLKTLSLNCCKFNSSEDQSCVEKLSFLRSLRTLDLIWMQFKKPGIYDTLQKLTNLENLDITMSRFAEEDHKRFLNSPKKWKKLALYRFEILHEESDVIYTLADQVFGVCVQYSPVLKNLLSSAEYYKYNVFVSWKFINCLYDNQHLLVEETPRIEKVILDNFEKEYDSNKGRKLLSYTQSKRCTPEFIKKFVNILYCHERNKEVVFDIHLDTVIVTSLILSDVFLPFLLKFIRKDLNRSVIKKVLQQISSIYENKSVYNENRELLELCESAIKQNLFDAEIRKVMSEILVHTKNLKQ